MPNPYAHARRVKARAAWKAEVKRLIDEHPDGPIRPGKWCWETLNYMYDKGMDTIEAASRYRVLQQDSGPD
jgi:hypothetical protein